MGSTERDARATSANSKRNYAFQVSRNALAYIKGTRGRWADSHRMKEIRLTNGKVVLVDDQDYERLSKYTWTCLGNRYALRAIGKRVVLIHREIMGASDGHEVDHINGNGLDCRRENMRLCNNQQNHANTKAHRDNHSGYKGVSFWDGKWHAQIQKDWQKTHLGCYDTPEAAARAYDKAALELHGAFARLNFPE